MEKKQRDYKIIHLVALKPLSKLFAQENDSIRKQTDSTMIDLAK